MLFRLSKLFTLIFLLGMAFPLYSNEINPTNPNTNTCYDIPNPYTSLSDVAGFPAGVYPFDFGDGVFNAYVDADGWMLFLQYHHAGGTNPPVNIISAGNDLPVFDPSPLGTDNSGDLSKWGHGAQAIAASIPDANLWLRWQGETSNHNRIVNFDSPVLGRFQDDSVDDITDIANQFIPGASHNASLPGSVNGGPFRSGDLALMAPFGNFNCCFYTIGEFGRWEVDDDTFDQHNTIHRVWVKSVPFDNTPIIDLKNHILEISTLTPIEIHNIHATLLTTLPSIANSPQDIADAIDLVETFETVEGPLFTSGSSTQGGFSKNPAVNTGLELERAMLTIQQGLFDYAFTRAIHDANPTLLVNKKFETSAFFPGAAAPPTNPNITEQATVKATFLEPWGTQPFYQINNDNLEHALRPTGLYLAPGSIATVTVPANIVNKGFKIQVGAHRWDLSNKSVFRRMDRISKLFDIDASTITILNPLGGGIYLHVPKGVDEGLITMDVTNVIRSPFYSDKISHQTSLQDWQNTERNHPGPWADFETNDVLFQVPSSWITSMNDPQTLMNDWDTGVAAVKTLLGRPLESDIHQLYMQPDVIFRGSAFFPGYPFSNDNYNPLAGIPNNPQFISGIANSPSVLWHELGHQVAISKFPGEVEALVNFLYVSVFNKGFNVDLDEAFSNSFYLDISIDNAAQARMITDTFRDGLPRDISNTESDEVRYQHRGYAHYAEIVDLFGWCAIESFFYNENVDFMNGINHGINNQDIDSRILRMSIAAGVDLRPLLHFYGIHPVNPSTLQNAIQQENLEPSTRIYNRLTELQSILPMNNADFMAHALERYPGGLGIGNDNPNFGRGWYHAWSLIYDETHGNAAAQALQNIINLYFPTGTPSINNDPVVTNENCYTINTLSVNELEINDVVTTNIAAIPNPVKAGVIKLKVNINAVNKEDANFMLFNVTGQLVKEWNHDLEKHVTFDISDIKPGALYLLKVTEKNGTTHIIKIVYN